MCLLAALDSQGIGGKMYSRHLFPYGGLGSWAPKTARSKMHESPTTTVLSNNNTQLQSTTSPDEE